MKACKNGPEHGDPNRCARHARHIDQRGSGSGTRGGHGRNGHVEQRPRRASHAKAGQRQSKLRHSKRGPPGRRGEDEQAAADHRNATTGHETRDPAMRDSTPENGDTRTKTSAIGIRAIAAPTALNLPPVCHARGSRK